MTITTPRRCALRTLLILTLLGTWLSACNRNVDQPTLSPVVESPSPTVPGARAPVPVATYRDELLGIEFSYPQTWGPIDARLEPCYYSGYTYEYVFQGEAVATGGRGFDCSEGHSAGYTDYPRRGYEAGKVCDFLGKRCLEEPGSEDFVHLTLIFPEAEDLCSGGYGNLLLRRVHAVVTVDLPEHPLIHGIIWLVPVLNGEREAELMGKIACDGEESHEAYTQAITALMEEIAIGGADAETQAAIESLRYMANSVRRIPTRPYKLFLPTPTREPAGCGNRDRLAAGVNEQHFQPRPARIPADKPPSAQ